MANERCFQAVRKRIAFLRAAEVGGCFRPSDEPQDGECADGHCFCARQVDKLANATVTALAAVIRTDDGAIAALGGTSGAEDLAAAIADWMEGKAP